jgi:hypothetical protein
MTDPQPPDPSTDDIIEEPLDAGTEGHDVPAELLELHGLIELANNGAPA